LSLSKVFNQVIDCIHVSVTNNQIAQSYIDFADEYLVSLALSASKVVDLLATFSGTYPILLSNTLQLDQVCQGVSAKALTESHILTATEFKTHATEIYQRSHFNIAQAVPEPPVAGNVFTEAS
jgi:hypothetical protein